MKLTELQLEIMDRARDKILNSEQTFICFAIEEAVDEMVGERARKLRCKAFFFGLRRKSIRRRLVNVGYPLSQAICASLYPHITFSNWLVAQLEGKGIKSDPARHRGGRVAWIDRIIDTGELN